MLRAEAADEAKLLRINELLCTRLETFGSRENLTITWQPIGGSDGPQPEPPSGAGC